MRRWISMTLVLLFLFGMNTPFMMRSDILNTFSTMEDFGSLPVRGQQIDDINNTVDDDPLVHPGNDSSPGSDKGIVDVEVLLIITGAVIFFLALAILIYLIFRRLNMKDVEWEEEKEDEDWQDDDPLPEDGNVNGGRL